MSTLDEITIDISVILGAATMPIHQLLRMGRGAVIELDTTEDDDLAVVANDVPIARGQVVLRGDKVGVTITRILDRSPTLRRPPSAAAPLADEAGLPSS